MKLTVKFILDVSQIKEDPDVERELLADERPFRAAAVRNQAVLASEEIVIKRREDISKIPVTLAFDYPGEVNPGVSIVIGMNLPEGTFLGAEPFKVWIGPEKFRNAVADLTKDKMVLPRHLFRRWVLLCRKYTISGRVVKRVWTWDPIEQMYVPCDEPVPGARVEAFDVDCWWFWWRRDLAGSAITNPDGTFEITFLWCCLLRLPILRPRWVIDPDLLKHITEAVKPHVGPIPPEALDSPVAFEKFLGVPGETPVRVLSHETSPETGVKGGSPCGRSTSPVTYGAAMEKSLVALNKTTAAKIPSINDIIDKIRPILPLIPCWPFRSKDCAPDIVFRVTQECGGTVNVIYDEKPFQTRWNIPASLNVTLLANDKACSMPVCEEPPPGDCLKFMWVNCIDVAHIGAAIGPPDLRGYAYPGSGDHPFAGTITVKGLFGAGSAVDYFRVEYAYGGGPFKNLPEDHLLAFGRSFWAPPPGSPPGTLATWNGVTFKPEPLDGKTVYKTLRKAEQENPLPPGWIWGFLWNDIHTLFPWNSVGLDGDGLYTIRLVGYRWDETTKKLVDEHVMKTCDVQTGQDEKVMIRIDNRNADDPLYKANEDRPCGAGTIHLCTYEPDCDFRKVELVGRDALGNPVGIPKEIGPCDIIELSDNDDIVIHFKATVPKSTLDGHLLAYAMAAHWGEDKVFDVIASGLLAADPDVLIGPAYGATFAGSQGTHRSMLPAWDPEHDRPCWFGGNFKITVKGKAFSTCAYTLSLRVWKRTIEGCTDPYYVHVNWCSYSFTILKV